MNQNRKFLHDSNAQQLLPLFLHIPKTGGSTFNNCIFNQCKTNDVYGLENDYLNAGIYYYPVGFFKNDSIEDLPPSDFLRALRLSDLGSVVGHFSYGVHRFIERPWTYITLLRELVDRIVSLYHHIDDDVSLFEFVENPKWKEVDNDMVRRISGTNPEIGACSTAMLTRAKENLKRHFTVIGLTECFDETLVLTKRKLCWKEVPRYLPTIVNFSRPREEIVPRRTELAILERNKLDAELYRYGVSLFRNQLKEEQDDFNRELEAYKERNEEYIKNHGIPSWRSSDTDQGKD
ncbi:hypothetical protein ACFL1S_02905 [Pseudomonadota bacterium]